MNVSRNIYISGAGGVGAFAVPVSLEQMDQCYAALVTDGGFGYKSPPQARVIDTCRRGSWHYTTRALIGETVATVEQKHYDRGR